MRCPWVEFPYVQPNLPLSRLSHARLLVSQELSADHPFQDVLQKAAELSRSRQQQNLEELMRFQKGRNLFLKEASADASVLFTPTRLRSASNFTREWARGGSMSEKMIESDDKVKRPRLESEEGGATAIRTSTEAVPQIGEGPENSLKLYPTYHTSSIMADAVYFESLLSQWVGSGLVLQFSDLEREGGHVLETLQREQEALFGLTKYIEDINALRCVEQKDFAKQMEGIQSQGNRLRAKIAALTKVLNLDERKNILQQVIRKSSHSILESFAE